MRQFKAGDRVFYRLTTETGGGEYDDERGEYIVEPTVGTFMIKGRLIGLTPNPKPAWWGDEPILKFVADSRLPEILFDLGLGQPTEANPWFVDEDVCVPIKTFRDWARGLK